MSPAERFIQKAKEIHGDKYNYSNVNYINVKTKVIITCFKHGDFLQSPNKHLCNRGCPICSLENRTTTKEEFIQKAIAIHGNKYIYNNINYINTIRYLDITCPKHGEFNQIGYEHLRGRGCPACAGVLKPSTEEFIKRAKEVHGDKYDYSKVNYINSQTKVLIICPIHGEFEQTPHSHVILKSGCKKCYINNKILPSEQFIEKAKEVHGNKYDYSNVIYIGMHDKVIIICPEHGEFKQEPNSHIYGSGCPKCNNNSLTLKQFIQKAKTIHGDRYDYSKVEYINYYTKVIILCPEHGEFEQTPNCHLAGSGCSECIKINTYKFIEKAIAIHGNKYHYYKVLYISAKDKVCIICKEHGEFLQTPNIHLNKSGCPGCNSSKGELAIQDILDKHNIENIKEYKIPEVADNFEYDFYLPEYNLLIEFQGIQHYKPIEFFGGQDNLEYVQRNDKFKKHNAYIWKYNLIEFNYKQLKYMYPEQFEELVINKINQFNRKG